VADGLPFRFAAALGGISADTFYEWKKEFPEFSDAIQKALAKGIRERVKVINAAAKRGDVRAAQWWLEHVVPEDFARNRVEHARRVEVPVEPKPSVLTLERMCEAYQRRYGRPFKPIEANSKSDPASQTCD